MQGSVMGKESGAWTMLAAAGWDGGEGRPRAAAEREKRRVVRNAVGCILKVGSKNGKEVLSWEMGLPGGNGKVMSF